MVIIIIVQQFTGTKTTFIPDNAVWQKEICQAFSVELLQRKQHIAF